MMVFTSPWLTDKFLTISFQRLFCLSRFHFDKWRNLQIQCEYLSMQNKHALIMYHLIQFLCTCTCMTFDLCTREIPFILILFKKYINITKHIQGKTKKNKKQQQKNKKKKKKKRRKRQSGGANLLLWVYTKSKAMRILIPSATILTTFMVAVLQLKFLRPSLYGHERNSASTRLFSPAYLHNLFCGSVDI